MLNSISFPKGAALDVNFNILNYVFSNADQYFQLGLYRESLLQRTEDIGIVGLYFYVTTGFNNRPCQNLIELPGFQGC